MPGRDVAKENVSLDFSALFPFQQSDIIQENKVFATLEITKFFQHVKVNCHDENVTHIWHKMQLDATYI